MRPGFHDPPPVTSGYMDMRPGSSPGMPSSLTPQTMAQHNTKTDSNANNQMWNRADYMDMNPTLNRAISRRAGDISPQPSPMDTSVDYMDMGFGPSSNKRSISETKSSTEGKAQLILPVILLYSKNLLCKFVYFFEHLEFFLVC